MDHSPQDALGATALRGASCSGSDLLRWLGMADQITAGSNGVLFGTRRVRAGAVLARDDAPFECLYVVIAGSFKCVCTDLEGYELVLGFHARGDVIGLEAISDGRHGGDAVALEDSTVAVVPFSDLVAAGHQVVALERWLYRASSRELERKNQTLKIVATVGAEVRLARFLLQTIRRQAELGYSARRIVLRMSRRDIASHLGLAHETISRSLTALAAWGLIHVRQREIEIDDAQGLERFERTTRGGSRAAIAA